MENVHQTDAISEVEKTPASPLPIIDFCLALDENKFFLLISKS